jgi:hypothetical protein
VRELTVRATRLQRAGCWFCALGGSQQEGALSALLRAWRACSKKGGLYAGALAAVNSGRAVDWRKVGAAGATTASRTETAPMRPEPPLAANFRDGADLDRDDVRIRRGLAEVAGREGGRCGAGLGGPAATALARPA